MKRLATILTVLTLSACGAQEQLDDAATEETTASETVTTTDGANEAATGDQFEGYVLSAFEIKVDGKHFSDSEDFYTRFVDELIKPKRPDLDASQVEVLGQYGVTSFGVGAPVFIAPSNGGDAHIYEATTDGNRAFKVNVSNASDETVYQAKTVLRIGLTIKGLGLADSDVKYCYLLHSTKDGVNVLDGGPIVFDEFTTQLNAWDCNESGPTTISGSIPSATTTTTATTATTETTTTTETTPTETASEEQPAPPAGPTKVFIGISTKADVSAAWGIPPRVHSATQWGYNNPVCERENSHCFITFNDAGVLISGYNINPAIMQ